MKTRKIYRNGDFATVVRSFFGGVLKFKEVYRLGKLEKCSVTLLGFELYSRIKHSSKLEYLFLNFKIRQIDTSDKKIGQLRKISQNKNLIILRSNSGEAYLVLKYFLDSIVRDYLGISRQQVLIVCTKKYHTELVKYICPKYSFIVEERKLFNDLPFYSEINGKKVINLFPVQYYGAFEFSQDPQKNYFSWMKTFFIQNGISLKESNPLKKHKIRNNRKKILLIPESVSSNSLNSHDIQQITTILDDFGYQLLINNPSIPFRKLLRVTRGVAGIIAVRSGIVDFLMEAQLPIFVIYSNLPAKPYQITDTECTSALLQYSLKQNPQYSPLLEEVTSQDFRTKLQQWIINLDRGELK